MCVGTGETEIFQFWPNVIIGHDKAVIEPTHIKE